MSTRDDVLALQQRMGESAYHIGQPASLGQGLGFCRHKQGVRVQGKTPAGLPFCWDVLEGPCGAAHRGRRTQGNSNANFVPAPAQAGVPRDA